jgi:hypothetical protein
MWHFDKAISQNFQLSRIIFVRYRRNYFNISYFYIKKRVQETSDISVKLGIYPKRRRKSCRKSRKYYFFYLSCNNIKTEHDKRLKELKKLDGGACLISLLATAASLSSVKQQSPSETIDH